MINKNSRKTFNSLNLQLIFNNHMSIIQFILSLLFIYILFAVYIYFNVDRLMFPAPPSSYQDSPEILKLTTPNNQKISALFLPNQEAKYTILYAHGNGEDLGNLNIPLERLRQLNFNVFAYDYRGYGTSEGKPSEKNAYDDIATAFNHLTNQLNINPQEIILYGKSIGGGSVIDLATKKNIAGLIVESTFTSIFRVPIPFPILPFDRFKNLQKIDKINCPLLVIHGEEDKLISINHAKKLFNQALPPKLYLWVENANHNNVIKVVGKEYEESINKLKQYLPKSIKTR